MTPYGERCERQGKVSDEEKENAWRVRENDDEEKENVYEERANGDEENHGGVKANGTCVVSENVLGFLFLWDCDGHDRHHHPRLGCNY